MRRFSGVALAVVCVVGGLTAPAAAAERPGVPIISSIDFPDGEPLIEARTTGVVRLGQSTPGVVEYLYGFQQDRVFARVKADADGNAYLPAIAFEDGRSSMLFAKAVDAQGRMSDRSAGWQLSVFDNPVPQAHERGDVSGDGRADVTVVLDQGSGRAMAWNAMARDGGFHGATVIFDSDRGNRGEANRYRPVRGDFDGDGRTDLVLLHQKPGGGVELRWYQSDGNVYQGSRTWDIGAVALSTAQVVAGDFTGDGKADVAVRHDVGGGRQVVVFPGGAFETSAVWADGVGGGDLVAGDFDGDSLADLAEVRDGEVVLHRSTGGAFDAGTAVWQGEPRVGRGATVGGDVDGDGRDDLITLYANGNGQAVVVVSSAAIGFAPREWGGGFGSAAALPDVGDFDLDGRDDLAVVEAGATTRLWTLTSNGTSFGDPVLGWEGVTGGAPLVFAP